MIGVIIMKDSKDLLSSILKTTQLGQVGLRSVMKARIGSDLKTALKSQLKEYDAIENEANALVKKNNWDVPQLSHSIEKMTDFMTRTRLSFGNTDSKAAAMMINGNTRGMIKSLKHLHHYNQSHHQLEEIANKLLACEKANIQQMQGFV